MAQQIVAPFVELARIFHQPPKNIPKLQTEPKQKQRVIYC